MTYHFNACCRLTMPSKTPSPHGIRNAESPAIASHRRVQRIAKSVLAELPRHMVPGATEATIAKAASDMLAARGVTQTWYHGVPALVLTGERTRLSISGREYKPANTPLAEIDLVTVDLSPELDGVWGDCARSFAIEDGCYTAEPRNAMLIEGLGTLAEFHVDMRTFATPDTTFEDLHAFATGWLAARGYENLDFLGNFGHSIVRRLNDRVYIEHGNTRRLVDAGLFTFEPHIRKRGDAANLWGYKHENIYYFDEQGIINEL